MHERINFFYLLYYIFFNLKYDSIDLYKNLTRKIYILVVTINCKKFLNFTNL